MANDVFQVNVIGSSADEYVENVLHMSSDATGSALPGADALALAGQFLTTNIPTYLACLGTDYVLGGLKVKRVNNTGGPGALALGLGAPGTFAGETVVSGAGGVLTAGYYDTIMTTPRWRTTRIFMPGLPAGAVDEGAFQPAYITALAAFAAQLATPITAGGRTFTYCAYKRSTGSAFTVNAPVIGKVLGTQRRRYRPVI